MTGSGHVTQKGWNIPAERLEYNAEDYRNDKIRCNSRRSDPVRNGLNGYLTDQAYDIHLDFKWNFKYIGRPVFLAQW